MHSNVALSDACFVAGSLGNFGDDAKHPSYLKKLVMGGDVYLGQTGLVLFSEYLEASC